MKIAVLALIVLTAVPSAGETDPTVGKESPSTPSRHAHASHAPDQPRYVLPAGKMEIGGLFGGNIYSGTAQPNPSLTGEFVYGLPHGFGIFAAGSWNRVFGYSGENVDVGVALHDVGGGLQWNPFRLGRFAPYLRGGVSWVRLSGGGNVGPGEFGFATNRLGANLGFGGRTYLARGYGVMFDVGVVQGPGMSAIGRFSTGLYYQFK